MTQCSRKTHPSGSQFLSVRSVVLLWVAAFLSLSAAQAHGEFALKDGDVVAFYGDSITVPPSYGTMVENYVVTRFPALHVAFINAGVGGEHVGGGAEGSVDQRLARDVVARKATVVRVSMKRLSGSVLVALLIAGPVFSQDVKPDAVLAMMKKVGDWQLANPSKHPTTDWTQAAGYAGFMALAEIADTPKYDEAMVAMGKANQWKPGSRVFHADDQCVGQTYVELFLKHKDPQMIAPLRQRFDTIMANPKDDHLEFNRKGADERWSWCDALFMAPPAWARLAKATGEPKYLDFANRLWWVTSDYLYDKEDHLYFRDSSFFRKREANGQKVFWSRGNGWVMGGLVRLMQYMPADYPDRAKYVQQFKEMADRVLSCQQPDGLWRASLLDPASYPLKETSGSGFYCYALAWGVNNGLLDRAKFGPAARKSWAALVGCVEANGKLTHVQPIGSDPKHFGAESTEVYGAGAFLLAGSEMYKLSQAAK